MHTFVFTVFSFQHILACTQLKNDTVFNTPACKQLKNYKMCILGLKLGNALTNVWIGIIFVEIECNLVIMWKKATLLYINSVKLVLK